MRSITTSRPHRLAAVVASVALTLTLTGGSTAASAQSFLDPADPCPPGVAFGPASFSDRDRIPPVHVLNVDCGAELDVVQGREDGQFQPYAMTRRDQMASFIVRGLEAAGYDLPAPRDQGFDDIGGSTHEDNINILAEIGVTEGRTATRYAPRSFVTRDQMASFVLRAAEFAYGDEGGLVGTGAVTFPDVPSANVHAQNISAASELLGLVEGKRDGRYDPRSPTRRDQMATFVIRLIDMIMLTE
jgi:hypothetical protein